jgi:hypothetical protein
VKSLSDNNQSLIMCGIIDSLLARLSEYAILLRKECDRISRGHTEFGDNGGKTGFLESVAQDYGHVASATS